IDGSSGLELNGTTGTKATLQHTASGLQLELELTPVPGNALVQRLKLVNSRKSGAIWIGAATTLALRLNGGDQLLALAADDAPNGWSTLRQSLPAQFGNHEL